MSFKIAEILFNSLREGELVRERDIENGGGSAYGEKGAISA